MDILNYLTGKAGLMILGLIAITAFLYRKYKTQRYFKHIEKKRKDKDSKSL
jgi:hypothetical protein